LSEISRSISRFTRAAGLPAVLHSGYGQNEVRIIDLKSEQPVSQAAIEESFYGLAWSPTAKRSLPVAPAPK